MKNKDFLKVYMDGESYFGVARKLTPQPPTYEDECR